MLFRSGGERNKKNHMIEINFFQSKDKEMSQARKLKPVNSSMWEDVFVSRSNFSPMYW